MKNKYHSSLLKISLIITVIIFSFSTVKTIAAKSLIIFPEITNVSPVLDTFPTYNITTYNLGLPIDTMGYTSDPGNEICGSMVLYVIDGMVSPTNAGWLIDDAIGTMNSNIVNSPTAKLCKLLKAYKLGAIDSVISLYKSSDYSMINGMLSNPAVRTHFQGMIDSITALSLKAGFLYGGGFLAFANITYIGNTQQITPYYFVQENNKWVLSTMEDSLKITSNIAVYLNSKSPSTMIISSDIDGDGIININDNCPCKVNPTQVDTDGDGIGDACDNCPSNANHNQADIDKDGVGDVCDNCPKHYNPLQTDTDNDHIGDSCDNCRTAYNPTQADMDGDYIGDACDQDMDNDGLPNNFDPDIDGDGIPNTIDNCPYFPNSNQLDSDGDGVGDACDNCPLTFNPDQADNDSDGLGDECDLDMDNDGVPNVIDNCPKFYNPDQLDVNCNGKGDACE
ncbi:MAG: thrombospondin type 3 repeat-containing protein [Bacteroidales bacterium]